MLADKRADLTSIAQKIGAGKFSFGKEDIMFKKLSTMPGSVTLFALLNDREKSVNVILGSDGIVSKIVNYHPLHNAASTVMDIENFLKFLRALSREPVIINCGIT